MANITSLGGALPLLSQSVSTLGRLENQITSYSTERAEDRLALKQLAERNRADEEIATQKSEQDKAILDAQAADDERRRSSALKRAVARQRAAYGGAGIDDGGDDGSGEAVLLGLFNESTQDQAAQDNIYGLRRQIIDDNLSSIKQRNLLEESQLAERNRKKRRSIFS